jgi:hypothetical protein
MLFEEAVQLCEARYRGELKSTEWETVPILLDEVFRRDEMALRSTHYADGPVHHQHALRSVTNVTCLRPVKGVEDVQLFNDELLALPTREGRACAGGACSCACSRVALAHLVSDAEISLLTRHADELQPPVGPEGGDTHNLYLKLCAAARHFPATLLFVRLLERMRRAIALEYGVPLAALSPRQAFISRVTPGADPERASIHVDECSIPSYHYSAVLYLTTSAEALLGEASPAPPPAADVAGGELRFYAEARGGAAPRPVAATLLPRRGTAALFSSGWENVHEVARVTAGQRRSLPAFFTTERPPERAPWEAEGAAGGAARAAVLWRHLLEPQTEEDFVAVMRHWAQLFDRAT